MTSSVQESKMFLKPKHGHQPVFLGKKEKECFKSRSELLQEFLKNHQGPLTFKNHKMLNARSKLHERRKKIANGIHKLAVINNPTTTVFKKKNIPEAKQKQKAVSTKNNIARCPAKKMDGNSCNAKLKQGKLLCGRHTKK